MVPMRINSHPTDAFGEIRVRVYREVELAFEGDGIDVTGDAVCFDATG